MRGLSFGSLSPEELLIIMEILYYEYPLTVIMRGENNLDELVSVKEYWLDSGPEGIDANKMTLDMTLVKEKISHERYLFYLEWFEIKNISDLLVLAVYFSWFDGFMIVGGNRVDREFFIKNSQELYAIFNMCDYIEKNRRRVSDFDIIDSFVSSLSCCHIGGLTCEDAIESVLFAEDRILNKVFSMIDHSNLSHFNWMETYGWYLLNKKKKRKNDDTKL